MIGYIAVGGLLGTVARYGLQGWVQQRLEHASFPSGTMVVNLMGSLALGFLMRYTTGSVIVSPEVRAGLTIGFCGAFTTMSTFAYETQALLTDGEYLPAVWYVGATFVGCVVAIAVGMALAQKLL